MASIVMVPMPLHMAAAYTSFMQLPEHAWQLYASYCHGYPGHAQPALPNSIYPEHSLPPVGNVTFGNPPVDNMAFGSRRLGHPPRGMPPPFGSPPPSSPALGNAPFTLHQLSQPTSSGLHGITREWSLSPPAMRLRVAPNTPFTLRSVGQGVQDSPEFDTRLDAPDKCASFTGFPIECDELRRIREFNSQTMPRMLDAGYRGIRTAMNARGFPGHVWHVGHACPDPSKKSTRNDEDFGWNLFAQHAVDNANLAHCLVSCAEAEHVGAHHVRCTRTDACIPSCERADGTGFA